MVKVGKKYYLEDRAKRCKEQIQEPQHPRMVLEQLNM